MQKYEELSGCVQPKYSKKHKINRIMPFTMMASSIRFRGTPSRGPPFTLTNIMSNNFYY
jgi:hypothetical protein